VRSARDEVHQGRVAVHSKAQITKRQEERYNKVDAIWSEATEDHRQRMFSENGGRIRSGRTAVQTGLTHGPDSGRAAESSRTGSWRNARLMAKPSGEIIEAPIHDELP